MKINTISKLFTRLKPDTKFFHMLSMENKPSHVNSRPCKIQRRRQFYTLPCRETVISVPLGTQ